MNRLLTYLFLLPILILSCSKDETPVIKYNVSILAEEGGTVSQSSGSYKMGETLSILATPLADYEFSHWTPGNSTENPLSIIVNSDIEIQAYFKMKDDDNDGVYNIYDECPNTPSDVLVSYKGCEAESFYEVLNYNILVSAGFNVNFNFNLNNIANSVEYRYFTQQNCYVDVPMFSESYYRIKNFRNINVIEKSFYEITYSMEYDEFMNPNVRDTITYGFYPEENGRIQYKSRKLNWWRWLPMGLNYLENISDKRRNGGIPQTEEEYIQKKENNYQMRNMNSECNSEWLDKIWFTEVYQNKYYEFIAQNGTKYYLHIFPFNEYSFELYVVDSNCAYRFKYTPEGLEKSNNIDLVSDFNPPRSGMTFGGITLVWDKNGDYSSNGLPDGSVNFSYNFEEINYNGYYNPVTIIPNPKISTFPNEEGNTIEISETLFNEKVLNLEICQ